MENNIMGLVGAFIGIAIMLGIGVQILGNSVQDCTTLPDYSEGAVTSVAVGTAGNYTSTPTVVFTGGGGTGAVATASVTAIAGGFSISSITVTNGGVDYATAPTVSFSGGAPVTTPATATASVGVPTNTWAAQCETNNAQAQNAYTLLVIILIVVAAVAILSVVRML